MDSNQDQAQRFMGMVNRSMGQIAMLKLDVLEDYLRHSEELLQYAAQLLLKFGYISSVDKLEPQNIFVDRLNTSGAIGNFYQINYQVNSIDFPLCVLKIVYRPGFQANMLQREVNFYTQILPILASQKPDLAKRIPRCIATSEGMPTSLPVFLALEKVPGLSLPATHSFLREVPFSELDEIIKDLADLLDWLKQQDLFLLDAKVENIFYDRYKLKEETYSEHYFIDFDSIFKLFSSLPTSTYQFAMSGKAAPEPGLNDPALAALGDDEWVSEVNNRVKQYAVRVFVNILTSTVLGTSPFAFMADFESNDTIPIRIISELELQQQHAQGVGNLRLLNAEALTKFYAWLKYYCNDIIDAYGVMEDFSFNTILEEYRQILQQSGVDSQTAIHSSNVYEQLVKTDVL